MAQSTRLLEVNYLKNVEHFMDVRQEKLKSQKHIIFLVIM